MNTSLKIGSCLLSLGLLLACGGNSQAAMESKTSTLAAATTAQSAKGEHKCDGEKCKHEKCAHKKGHHNMEPGAHADKMKEMLGLDDTQTASVKSVFVEMQPRMQAMHTKMKALHEKLSAEAEPNKDPATNGWAELKSEKEQLFGDVKSKLKEILNEEQFGKFLVEAEKMHKGHHHGKKAKKHECGENCDGKCEHGKKEATSQPHKH
jgi:hypothetical protein